MAWAGMPPEVAFAHKEQMHGATTILAWDYIAKRRASAELNPDPESRNKAQVAIDIWRSWLTDFYSRADADPLAKMTLGLQPNYPLTLNTSDPSQAGLSLIEAPAMRENPGLSGYFSVQDVESLGGAKEFPKADAALLAYLTAEPDRAMDIWGDTVGPLRGVKERIDEEGEPLQKIFYGLADLSGGTAINDIISSCTAGDSFWRDLGCGLAAILTAVAAGIFAPALLAAAALGALLSQIGEGITEDIISGCDDSGSTGSIEGAVQDLTELNLLSQQEAAAIKIMIRNDMDASDSFFQSLGITFDDCDEMEEGLELMDRLRLYGTIFYEWDLMFTLRARLVDVVETCRADGHDISSCADLRGYLTGYMSQTYPWALSAEYAKRRTNGLKGYWQRWVMPLYFTANSHFFDLLSPVHGKAAGGAKIDFLQDTIGVMKTGANGGRFGRDNAFDGYSLGEGNRFCPQYPLLERFGYEFPEPLISHHDHSDPTPPLQYQTDDTILAASGHFDIHVAHPSYWMTLRRRVCTPQAGGQDPHPSLRTHDGLPATICEFKDDRDLSASTMFNPIHVPADIGALDGMTRWLERGVPEIVRQGHPSDNANNGVGPVAYYDEHTFVQHYLPFFQYYDPSQNIVTIPSGPLQCGLQPGDPASDCAPNESQALNHLGLTSAASDALALRGVGLALHMLQDLTVPHHLAPTSGFGHADYEQWFEHFVWPVDEGTDTLEIGENHICFCRDSHAGYNPDPGSMAPECRSTTCWYGEEWRQYNGVGVSGRRRGGDHTLIGARDTIENLWKFSHTGGMDRSDALYSWISSPHGSSPPYGDISTHPDPDPYVEEHRNFFWKDVDRAYDRLLADMEVLAQGAECQEFSTRRLAWATAWNTAKIVAEVSAEFADEADNGYNPYFPGSDDSVTGELSQNARVESAFWLISASALERSKQSLREVVGTPVWGIVARRTAPFLIASTAIFLTEAAFARSTSGATTCDRPGYNGPPDDGVTPTNRPGGGGDTCEARRLPVIMQCFDPSLPTPTNGLGQCADYTQFSFFQECQQGLRKDDCAQVAEKLASCACNQAPRSTLPSGTATTETVNSCVVDELRRVRLGELYRSGKISLIRYHCHLGLPVGPDADGDCVPDDEDECPEEALAPGFFYAGTNDTVRADLCERQDQEKGECKRGCFVPQPGGSIDDGGGE